MTTIINCSFFFGNYSIDSFFDSSNNQVACFLPCLVLLYIKQSRQGHFELIVYIVCKNGSSTQRDTKNEKRIHFYIRLR